MHEARREPYGWKYYPQGDCDGQDDGTNRTISHHAIECEQRGMGDKGQQNGPCDGRQKGREECVEFVGDQCQEGEEENNDNPFAVHVGYAWELSKSPRLWRVAQSTGGLRLAPHTGLAFSSAGPGLG